MAEHAEVPLIDVEILADGGQINDDDSATFLTQLHRCSHHQ